MQLTSDQLITLYNAYASKPVAKFPNDGIARYQVNRILAKNAVTLEAAVAEVFPPAPKKVRKGKSPATLGAEAAKADDEARELARMAEQVEISNAKYEAYQAARLGAGEIEVKGKARALIVAACSRPEGATAKELFATTGWKYASWSHQLQLITKQTGVAYEIRKVDGATRYFLKTGA